MFCDPNSPWQKGTVENTNRRIRRFLPRDIDLMQIDGLHLSRLCRNIIPPRANASATEHQKKSCPALATAMKSTTLTPVALQIGSTCPAHNIHGRFAQSGRLRIRGLTRIVRSV